MFFFVRIMRAGRAGAEMLSPSCVGRGSAPHYPNGRIGAMKILLWTGPPWTGRPWTSRIGAGPPWTCLELSVLITPLTSNDYLP